MVHTVAVGEIHGSDVFSQLQEGLHHSLKTRSVSEPKWLRSARPKLLCRRARMLSMGQEPVLWPGCTAWSGGGKLSRAEVLQAPRCWAPKFWESWGEAWKHKNIYSIQSEFCEPVNQNLGSEDALLPACPHSASHTAAGGQELLKCLVASHCCLCRTLPTAPALPASSPCQGSRINASTGGVTPCHVVKLKRFRSSEF